jgi:hypothetical protein
LGQEVIVGGLALKEEQRGSREKRNKPYVEGQKRKRILMKMIVLEHPWDARWVVRKNPSSSCMTDNGCNTVSKGKWRKHEP